ncbi:hypothetical protein BDV35DRAFT_380001 [Aspergillus flavus]|uniref:Transcription factor domain-containing protein n=1 Tax=Aspergillus flavus TaxID=5059 RepID=A0A5N6GZA0_ASPFL|nr:hypothetical protein BDV35DRAFT_380001 [Aspergillus flavus]
MIESASFVAAAMSLASRQLGHIEQRQNSVTLELYQYTIRLLISQDPNKADATVLATCALLCVYEMMASGVSEWRRHLKIFGQLPAGKTTLVPTDFWMDDMSIVSAAADGDTENYCNLAILVFAKIVNLLATFSLSNRMSESEPRASMTVLWNEFQEWYQLRPKQVYPLLRSDYTPSNTLPNVAFTQSSPVCGNTFYHAGCILLLQAGLLTVQARSSQVSLRLNEVRCYDNRLFKLKVQPHGSTENPDM